MLSRSAEEAALEVIFGETCIARQITQLVRRLTADCSERQIIRRHELALEDFARDVRAMIARHKHDPVGQLNPSIGMGQGHFGGDNAKEPTFLDALGSIEAELSIARSETQRVAHMLPSEEDRGILQKHDEALEDYARAVRHMQSRRGDR